MIDRVTRGTRKCIRRVLALTVMIVVLLAPSVAFASGSPTCNAYNPQTCSSVGSSSVTSANTSGSLPFTGLDLVLLVAGAATLIGAGLTLRRLTRRLD